MLTEVAGAPFLKQAAGGAKGKRSAKQGDGDSSAITSVDVNELLQPAKKKARRAPKGKAKPSKVADAGPEANAQSLAEDIIMMQADDDADEEGASTRARWWIDDMIACMVHAAGGALACEFIWHCAQHLTVRLDQIRIASGVDELQHPMLGAVVRLAMSIALEFAWFTRVVIGGKQRKAWSQAMSHWLVGSRWCRCAAASASHPIDA